MRERDKEKERETAQVVVLAEYAGFSSVSLGYREISHTHAGCLHWHMGLVQYYSTLPSLFGIVCFASCLHIQTHMLVCMQLLTIQANHRHHGNSLLATGKADAWSESKTEQRGAVKGKCQRVSASKDAITSFYTGRVNQIGFRRVNIFKVN